MTGKVDSSGTRRYRCARPHWQITEYDQPFCQGSVKAETLAQHVWDAVERVLREPDTIAAEIARQHGDIETRHAAIARERQLITTAKIKRQETVIAGIENAPKTFIGLFKGDNVGKMLVKL